jgi:hypothetical protein
MAEKRKYMSDKPIAAPSGPGLFFDTRPNKQHNVEQQAYVI